MLGGVLGESLWVRLAGLSDVERERLLSGLDDDVLAGVLSDWRLLARPDQLAPPGEWTIWLFMAGRGAGKTRAASEWVHERAIAHLELTGGKRAHRVALAGRASPDVRDVMIEGESGVLAVAERRGLVAKYEPSKRRVVWPDLHCVATTFTAEEPDQARGPEFHTVWADEIAAWDHLKTDPMGNSLWTNLMFGLRLGDNPKAMATTTPKRVDLVRELAKRGEDVDDTNVILTNASTMANAANLAQSFIDEVHSRYGGTHLATQELEGKLLGDVEGALWNQQMIDNAYRPSITEWHSTVVAVDPPTGDGRDEAGIIVAALTGTLNDTHDRCAVVLDDRTVTGTPERWGYAAVQAATEWNTTRIIAESNQGGQMVASVIRNADPTGLVKVKLVHAKDSKRLRAEPVAQLYEQGRVGHLERWEELEDQMTSWVPTDRRSPDRLDALVHALTALLPEISTRPAAAHSPLQYDRILGRPLQQSTNVYTRPQVYIPVPRR